ncbi:hypothetical protein D3OALGA1CA_3179 [Olavius algarvensis associated proteobacterium Delta 3]|nr:hypothetical protein D3OALGB2SA_1501 [Olavius algarvensis associated proteobacterium Delta 3]CAB5130297.1 hypothetical protein D3OALGA1CA_3179 [Olavius algarvensis associated proteobacterium Delta 3]
MSEFRSDRRTTGAHQHSGFIGIAIGFGAAIDLEKAHHVATPIQTPEMATSDGCRHLVLPDPADHRYRMNAVRP